MSAFRYLKKFLRTSDKTCNSFNDSVDSVINLFNYPVDNKLEEVSQRNNDMYGFNVLDDLPFTKSHERYKKWLYSDEEE